ncbi:MAG: DUF4231 domain-containing protein, partial [Candidatus Helarchaeota archaeon]|nr:DUF4231 domain-containing protein [Candidatus Helarchaeota archaeon]
IYVNELGFGYIKANKLDSVISLVIILSPLLELLSFYFIAAPLLRLIRISKIVRLGGIISRTQVSWRKTDFKAYAVAILVISIGFVLSFFRPSVELLPTDSTWLAIFISVVGVVFALLSAFMIVNSWNKYNSLEETIRKETISLRNIFLLGQQLCEETPLANLKTCMQDYIHTVIDAYWHETTPLDAPLIKFFQIFRAAEAFNPQTEKNYILLYNINEELRKASNHRANISSLISQKTPKTLWLFLLFLSFSIVVSFIIVDYETQWMATLIITLIATAIAFVIAIIYDLDNAFTSGVWAISEKEYYEVEDLINGKY